MVETAESCLFGGGIMSIDELIRQAEQLPPDQQLRLAAHLVEFAKETISNIPSSSLSE